MSSLLPWRRARILLSATADVALSSRFLGNSAFRLFLFSTLFLFPNLGGDAELGHRPEKHIGVGEILDTQDGLPAENLHEPVVAIEAVSRVLPTAAARVDHCLAYAYDVRMLVLGGPKLRDLIVRQIFAPPHVLRDTEGTWLQRKVTWYVARMIHPPNVTRGHRLCAQSRVLCANLHYLSAS